MNSYEVTFLLKESYVRLLFCSNSVFRTCNSLGEKSGRPETRTFRSFFREVSRLVDQVLLLSSKMEVFLSSLRSTYIYSGGTP